MRKRYQLIVWEWDKKLVDVEVEFNNDVDAEHYALGMFNGLRYNEKATGYSIKEIGLPRKDKVLTDEVGEVRREICKNMYDSQGNSKVYGYANVIGMPYTPCSGCEADTPTIIFDAEDECGLCGQTKTKQERYTL